MKKKHLLSLILFSSLFFKIGYSGVSFAQNRNIDSLLTLLKTNKPDTSQVNHLIKLTSEYINIREYNSALKYANKSLALASSVPIKNKRGWNKGIATAYNNIGIIYNGKGNYTAALKNHFEALKLLENKKDKHAISNTFINIGNIYYQQINYPAALKNYLAALKINQDIGDKKGIATSNNNIGRIYHFQSNYPDALKHYYAALKIMEDIKDKKGISISYGYIGNLYFSQGNYTEALKNYETSLAIKIDIGDKRGIAGTYNNIGIINIKQGNYSQGLINHFASLKVKEEIKDKQGIAASYNNIGVIYKEQGNYPEALKNFFSSLKIKENIQDRPGIATSFMNIGEVQIKLHQLKAAQNYFNKALQQSLEIGNKKMIGDSYHIQANLDSLQSNWKAAYLHHKLFIVYRDSIDNEETKKRTTEIILTNKFEKQEAATKAEQDKKDTIATANKKRQQLILILVSIVLMLVFIFAGLILRSLRVTRKQKVTIEEKNKLVEEKNKDIIDSINYAKRIQDALLKEEKHVSLHLPEHFILFKPKDIVSGDFYWSFEKKGISINEFQNKDRTTSASEKTKASSYWYLAAADCTGHGVPGAFMSMLGIAFLNEITANNEPLSPAEILDQLRDKIVKELGQSGKEGQSKDGMDISLMRLDLETMELQWAGANNSLWVVKSREYQNGNTEQGERRLLANNYLQKNLDQILPISNSQLLEIKPNKQPIGYHLAMQPFSNHVIQLKKNDVFYLFTDGYADQFGGEKKKKFMYAKLKSLLISMNGKAINDYKENLNKTFENWKGDLEQVDDVCIIGVKI